MQDWQQRVVDEKAELDGRLKRLRQFIASDAYDALSHQDASLLVKQAHQMMDLSFTLKQRIARFV